MSYYTPFHKIIDVKAPSVDILNSFSNLTFDQYIGKNRFRRFSQYKMNYTKNNKWNFDLLPHKEYVAYSKYNSVAGGIRRFYDPIEVDFTTWINTGAKEMNLDTSEEWQINVHQYRVLVGNNIEGDGITVPEGIHKDGHEYVMIAVFGRCNIKGGEMKLYTDSKGDECFFNKVVKENQIALLDDMEIYHYVTPISTIKDDLRGHRDILVVAFSKWKDKWYGDEFIEKALD